MFIDELLGGLGGKRPMLTDEANGQLQDFSNAPAGGSKAAATIAPQTGESAPGAAPAAAGGGMDILKSILQFFAG